MSKLNIIDQLGGTSAVARLCGVAPSSVSTWRKGIPAERCAQLERMTGHPVEQLNPRLRWARVPMSGWPNGAPALLVAP